ncbi:MAG: hypothetical protein JHD09_02295 [Gemmataceae bacterium]|jgi:hypothetical protein|nr:hypothetical protein [Gemmataceae bacterium]MBJ7432757.1 hypothetical protein [Gemmataceae bacterium]MBJ7497042.1 hypothetical protein [Gemmataceae bacterium]
MNQDELIASFQGVLAHLWMIRTFLKHADEIQDDENMLEVPRTLFDYIRATEPAYQRADWADFFHRLNGKFSRLKKANIYYQENFKTFSDHTNFQMAASSLAACVTRLQELLTLVDKLPQQPLPSSDPTV